MSAPNNPSAASQSAGAANRTAAAGNSNGTAAAASARPAARGGRGNSTFSTQEKLNFLTIMRDIQPIDGNEWDVVLEQHNLSFEHCHRTIPSLRRKFQELYRKKIPSGDPMMPEEVRMAKHVMHLITDKSEVSASDEVVEQLASARSEGTEEEKEENDGDDDDDDDDDGGTTGEFARPNTEDQDRNLVQDRPSSAETNNYISAMRPTPRRSNATSAPNDMMQLQIQSMSEARERHERYMEEERERHRQEERREERRSQERREERQQFMDILSVAAKAYFDSHKKDDVTSIGNGSGSRV